MRPKLKIWRAFQAAERPPLGLKARYRMSRRSGSGSPIKDMRQQRICSASRAPADCEVMHYGWKAL